MEKNNEIVLRLKDPGISKLDKYREEKIALLKTGSPKTYFAKKYGL